MLLNGVTLDTVVCFLEHALPPPHTKLNPYNNHVAYRHGSERLGYLPKATQEVGGVIARCWLTLREKSSHREDCEPLCFT